MKNKTGKIEKIETQSNSNRRSASNLAVLSVIAAGCMWGSMGLWVHHFSQALSSIDILALRIVLTVLILGAFLLIYNRKLLKIRIKDLWCFVGTGICSIVFFGYCYNRTILLASMSVAAILLYTAPIFVMVLSAILFKEKVTVTKIAALLLAFAGCICVTGVLGGNNTVSMLGLLTGLGSGFGYALYSIFSRFALQRKYDPFTITWYTFLCGLVACLFLADWHSIGSFVLQSHANTAYCIAYGLVTTVFPYILYTLGLSSIDNGKASVMATIEPVVATLLGVIVMHEPMSILNAAGVIMVLLAVVLLGRAQD